jgi:hypothetical protein
MKRYPSDHGLNWSLFKDRFEEFVKMMSLGKIKLSDEGLPALMQSPIWQNTNKSCHFEHNGSTCQARIHRTSHPKLIFETLLGEGPAKNARIDPPKIARIDLSFAKQDKESTTSNLDVYKKIHTILSVIFVFKPNPAEVEVYSSVWVNGITEEADSLTLSPTLVGTVICSFAENFERKVVKEKHQIPLSSSHRHEQATSMLIAQ